MHQITLTHIRKKYESRTPLTMITAYDATFASMVEQSPIDMILVGDSLGNVMQGHDTTLPVTLDQMIYHCQCVTRVAKRPFVIGDLPFGTYQGSLQAGLEACFRLMKEGQVQAVKLEGGAQHCQLVQACVNAGIPVFGHLGLTPQSVHTMGGYKVQARDADAADKVIRDAFALQEAGACAIVLECMAQKVADQITENLSIPTIGIGAGPNCSGQVLVLQDMLGMTPSVGKFVKRYENFRESCLDALNHYAEEVEKHSFPGPEHSYSS